MKDHWAVTVERNGERVVTIESECLSGRETSIEDEVAIRTAAHHLLAFIGDPAPPARPEARSLSELSNHELFQKAYPYGFDGDANSGR